MSAGDHRAPSRTSSNAPSCSLQARTLTVLCSWWHRASLVQCSYSTFIIGRRIHTRCRPWWVRDETTSAVRGLFDTILGGTEGVVRRFGVPRRLTSRVLWPDLFPFTPLPPSPNPPTPYSDNVKGRFGRCVRGGGPFPCALQEGALSSLEEPWFSSRSSSLAEFTQPHLFLSAGWLST